MEGKGRVLAADCSGLAPAAYAADEAFLVPRIDAPDYREKLIALCREQQVTGVLSLIDPELALIAEAGDELRAVGTMPLVSSKELCDLCLDKYAMYEKLTSLGIPTARCFLTLDAFEAAKSAGEIDFPVFVKPRLGSASIQVQRVDDPEFLEILMRRCPDLMIQEYMPYQEYGCDAYLDLLSGRCTSLFLKKKIRMRAGETDKSVSVHDEACFALVKNLAETLGFRGVIDIDLFRDEESGTWYVSEINPRFGGGYPHAFACGVDFPALVVENLEGRETKDSIGSYPDGVYMMKYNEMVFLPEEKVIR